MTYQPHQSEDATLKPVAPQQARPNPCAFPYCKAGECCANPSNARPSGVGVGVGGGGQGKEGGNGQEN